MERYYVKVKGSLGATVAHDTLADAYTEARRVFDKIGRDRRVYVLQVIGTIEPREGTVEVNGGAVAAERGTKVCGPHNRHPSTGKSGIR